MMMPHSKERDVVPDPPAPTVPDGRPVILGFGDSLTAGYGVPHGSAYPDLLQKILDNRGYRYQVINAGISGDTTSGGVARLLSPGKGFKEEI